MTIMRRKPVESCIPNPPAPAWPADSHLLCFSPMLIPLIINKQDCTQSVKSCPQVSWLTKRAGVSNIY